MNRRSVAITRGAGIRGGESDSPPGGAAGFLDGALEPRVVPFDDIARRLHDLDVWGDAFAPAVEVAEAVVDERGRVSDANEAA